MSRKTRVVSKTLSLACLFPRVDRVPKSEEHIDFDGPAPVVGTALFESHRLFDHLVNDADKFSGLCPLKTTVTFHS
jgi:hypothetical protein